MESRAQRIRKKIEVISEIFKLGKSVSEFYGKNRSHGGDIIGMLADDHSTNRDNIRKAKKIAETYTDNEIMIIFDLMFRTQKDQGPSKSLFSFSHLTRLLTVESKEERETLLERSLEEGWSLSRLNQEISQKFGPRKQGGRKPQIPNDLPAFLGEMEKSCLTWRRWFQEVSKSKAEVQRQHITLEDLPRSLRGKVEKIAPLMENLHQAVESYLGKRNSDRFRRQLPG